MKKLFIPEEAFDQKPKDEDVPCCHPKHPGYDDGSERYNFYDMYCNDTVCIQCICSDDNKDEYKRRYRLKKLKEIKDERIIRS